MQSSQRIARERELRRAHNCVELVRMRNSSGHLRLLVIMRNGGIICKLEEDAEYDELLPTGESCEQMEVKCI